MMWFSSAEQWEMVEREIADGARRLQKLLHAVRDRLCNFGPSLPNRSGDHIAVKYSKLPSSFWHGGDENAHLYKRCVGREAR
ncbi:hypothetical protein R1flu_015104 [Riccia fluitans]|uniref:Uncharacterized protein n=1 Tax=Riccia fluitans TaxID=41844 RepID=A0ABD1YIA1_9MARC